MVTVRLLDKVKVSDVLDFEASLLQHFEDEFPEVLDDIETSGALSDELAAKMTEVISNFLSHYGKEEAKSAA